MIIYKANEVYVSMHEVSTILHICARCKMADEFDANWPQIEEVISAFRCNPEDPFVLLASLQHLIENGKAGSVEKTLTNPENKDIIESVGWELVGVLVPILTDEQRSRETKDSCLYLLYFICERCTAKEVLLTLLEALGQRDFVVRMQVLSKPLALVLLRIERRKSRFLKMILECLLRNIKNMSIPHGGRLGEVTERTVMDKCRENGELNEVKDVLKNVLEFLQPTAKELRAFYEECDRGSIVDISPG